MPLVVTIKVVPGSGRYKWVLDKSGILKCYLTSQPEKGRANAELIKNLAKDLKIRQHDITIVSGETTRNKRLSIETTMTWPALCAALGLAIDSKDQMKLF